MIYLDDNIVRHPKILKAGTRVGGANGPACALAVFLDGLGYARQHLTDGFVPKQAVAACALVGHPLDIATALVAANLWEIVPDGFRIHDFHDWNKTAAEIKRTRRNWRTKKRKQRRSNNGNFSEKSRGESPRDKLSPRDEYRDSRARTRSHNHNHKYKYKPRSIGPGSSTACVLTARSARGIPTTTKTTKTPTHRILCSMLRAELGDDLATLADALEGVKVRCARQGFAYPDGDRLDAAVHAVERVMRKAS